MTLSISRDARAAIEAWLARDPSRPALRLMFAGGCGALGYRLTPAASPMAGDEVVEIDGLTCYLDYKSRSELDGARIEKGETADDIVLVHHQAVVGCAC